jgi:hypothetical protein
MLQCLGRLAETAQPQVGTELARLQLKAIELLHPHRGRLSRTNQQALEKIHTQALVAIEEEHASVLLAQNDRQSLQQALQKWRELEKKSPPGSPRWFRAKYSIAFSHYRLGNKQQADKIIRLLQLLHPDSGGPEMKTRFNDLLQRCRQ